MHSLTKVEQASAENFCRTILPEVSRTFALNIPVLPAPLDMVVTVGYLLCRIADTLEDESEGTVAVRRPVLAEFARLTELPSDWRTRATTFTDAACQALRPSAPASEVRLLRETPVVLEALAQQPRWALPHVARCVRDMTAGMADVMEGVEKAGPARGLAGLQETLQYCYYVAGTVGEMLTGLFAGYTPDVAARLDELAPRAPAFGRALQLTNILRDVREDLERGSCWLPRDLLARHGLCTDSLLRPEHRSAAVAMLDEMIGVAHREVQTAFEYCLAIPREQVGIRLFCLWPLFFAALTLKALHGNAAVFDPTPVKISGVQVKKVMMLTRALVGRDRGLRFILRSYTTGLPLPSDA